MIETIVLLSFVLSLIICVYLNISIVVALLIGFVLFFTYALYEGFAFTEVLKMFSKGILKVKNVVITLLIIGVLTAVWRSSGTIAFIIYYASKLIHPNIFIFITFILCSFVSFLIGTAFGTAATIGTICMTMGKSFGLDPAIVGGAILSGVYFGDRCSPMSTSALLVSEVTKTDIFINIKLMVKTAFIPFIITCLIYLFAGFIVKPSSGVVGIEEIFKNNFNLSIITIVPAIIILLFSFFKVKVKKTMIISVITASLICIFLQGVSIEELFNIYIYGFTSTNKELSAVLSGGGILSMIKVVSVVCISSSYAGIFENTNLLINIKKSVSTIANKVTTFGSVIIISIFTSMISCNQTLAIMLTEQLCNELIENKQELAITLANTVVLIAGLIPWSIAANTPLSSVSAPDKSILFAVYLYIVPICSLIDIEFRKNREYLKVRKNSYQEGWNLEGLVVLLFYWLFWKKI